MKRQIYVLLCLVSIGCRKEDTEPDVAATVAGEYTLVYSYYSNSNQSNVYFPGSLTLTRVGPTTIKPTFKLNGLNNSIIGDWNWNLMKVSKDTVNFKSTGYGGKYQSGQIDMSGYADGTLFFRFKKTE